MKNVTPQQLEAAKKEWMAANPGKTPTADDISGQAYTTLYNQAFADSGFGTGGKVQQAIQAATAAVQGLAGGDLTKAIAGGSAPYIANIIGSSGMDDAGKVLAHAAVNAALAAAQAMNAIGSNSPTIINERSYSAHAIDRMQGRGIPPSAVENAIKTGTLYPTKPGTTGYYDPANNVRVITNTKSGNVVTVLPGAPTSK